MTKPKHPTMKPREVDVRITAILNDPSRKPGEPIGRYVIDKKPKKFDRMMDNLELAMKLAPDQAGKIIAEAAQALHRVNRIAQAGQEWERFDILPTAGPRTGFMGRVIWEDEHRTPNGRSKRRELIETQGGALVAVDTSYALDDRERDLVKVHVARPQEDQAAQRAEIMEFWDWDDGTLGLTKKLGWNTSVWID